MCMDGTERKGGEGHLIFEVLTRDESNRETIPSHLHIEGTVSPDLLGSSRPPEEETGVGTDTSRRGRESGRGEGRGEG